MDSIRNPYTPGAGTRPVELAGREAEIEAFRVLVGRLKRGRTEQSQLIKGLRGVGKTVLLNTFEDHAESEGFLTSFRELTPENRLVDLLAKDVQRALQRLSLGAKATAAIRSALSNLNSIKLSGPGDLGIVVEVRHASEEALTEDFTELLLQLGRAASNKGRGVAFFFDEVQFVKETEFRALISALHRVTQKQLPVTVAAAGLPQLPRLAGEARSYAERLFTFPDIGPLPDAAATAALTVPAERENVAYEPKAIELALQLTAGYPFYIQQLGKHIWNLAESSPIGPKEVKAAGPLAEEALDRSLYEVRIQRATEREREVLRAMAELGSGPYRTGDVAKLVGTDSPGMSRIRQRLIRKGFIYATEDFGYIDFTVPRFAEFMRRYMPLADT
jgi:hypothetical protein